MGRERNKASEGWWKGLGRAPRAHIRPTPGHNIPGGLLVHLQLQLSALSQSAAFSTQNHECFSRQPVFPSGHIPRATGTAWAQPRGNDALGRIHWKRKILISTTKEFSPAVQTLARCCVTHPRRRCRWWAWGCPHTACRQDVFLLENQLFWVRPGHESRGRGHRLPVCVAFLSPLPPAPVPRRKAKVSLAGRPCPPPTLALLLPFGTRAGGIHVPGGFRPRDIQPSAATVAPDTAHAGLLKAASRRAAGRVMLSFIHFI